MIYNCVPCPVSGGAGGTAVRNNFTENSFVCVRESDRRWRTCGCGWTGVVHVGVSWRGECMSGHVFTEGGYRIALRRQQMSFGGHNVTLDLDQLTVERDHAAGDGFHGL